MTCLKALNLVVHSAHTEGILDKERCSALLALCDGKRRLMLKPGDTEAEDEVHLHEDILAQMHLQS